MYLAKNIRFLRDIRGMTQAELAEITDVTDKAVSTWENGACQPRMGVIEILCNHFNLSKSALIDRDLEAEFSTIQKPATGEGGGLDEETKTLIKLYHELPKDDRDLLIQQAELLKKRRK